MEVIGEVGSMYDKARWVIAVEWENFASQVTFLQFLKGLRALLLSPSY